MPTILGRLNLWLCLEGILTSLFVSPKFCISIYCFQFLLGPFYLPRENEDNAYAKFWADKQRALWYVMVFSGVNDVARE